MANARSLHVSLVVLSSLALLGTGCGTPDREEVARLEAENEALRSHLARSIQPEESPPSQFGPASPSSSPAADDWSWANAEPEPTREVIPASQPPAPRPRAQTPPPQPKPPTPPPPSAPAERFPPANAPAESASQAPAETPSMEARRASVGSALSIATVGELSSQTSQVGDHVEARLDRDLLDPRGLVVLPAGTVLTGRVTEVQSAKKVKKKSRLAFQLDTATLPDGRSVAIAAGRALEGEGWRKKDGAIIGGSAAGGAVLGQVLGGDTESTAAGAVIGGAIASGVIMSKQGEATIVPAGSILELALQSELSVEQPVG